MARVSTAKSGGAEVVNGEVRLTGDNTRLDSALIGTSKNVGLVVDQLGKLAAAQDKSVAAHQRVRAATEVTIGTTVKAAGASANLTSTYNRLGFAAHQLVAGTASFNTALQGVLGTLGPWGVAIGAAVGVVWHFVEGQHAAEEATKKATQALIEQRKEAAKKSKIEFYEDVVVPERVKAAEERTGVKSLRETEDFLEEEEALKRRDVRLARNAKDTALAKQQLSEVRAAQAAARIAVLEGEREIALARDDTDESLRLRDEAEKVRRQERIRLIDDEEKAEKKKHKAVADSTKEELELARRAYQLELARTAAYEANWEHLKRIDANNLAAREKDWAEFEDAITAITAKDSKRREQLHEAEMTRMQALSEAKAIKDPVLAQLEAQRIEEEYNFAQRVETFDQQREFARQERHAAELQRIDEEKRAHEQQQEKIQKGTKIAAQYAGQIVTGLFSVRDARLGAERAARAQGKTEAEAARAGQIAELQARASQLQGIRNMAAVKAIEQTAEGIGALASFNYVGAALHFASAAAFGVVAGAAGVRSNTLSDRAAGMEGAGASPFGSGSSFGPGRGGGASGGAANNGPSANTGPIPGSPTPQPRSGQYGGNVNFIHVEHVHGKMDRDTVRDISEQQRAMGYSGRNF